jgi:beta-lactamase regulating signal transducer with metallopeptidase domain
MIGTARLLDLSPALLRAALDEVVLSTVVCVIVLLACRVIRGRWPAFEQALWALVLVRLILPPRLAQPWGLGSLVSLFRPHAAASGESFSGIPTPLGLLQAPSPAVAESEWRHYGPIAALVVWGIAVAALLLWDATRLQRCRAWLTQATPIAAPPLTRLLETWRRCLRIRASVRLVALDATVTPFTLGVWRPIVCLPRHLLDPAQRSALHAALAHELAHVARHDSFWLWLQRAIERLYFFHPVVWIVSRRLSAGREGLCDRLVISQGLMSREDYSQGLLDALSLDLRGVQALGLTHTKRRLAMRIRQVLSMSPSQRQRSRGAIAASAVLGVFLLPLASSATPDAQAPNASRAATHASATTQSPVSLSDPLPGSHITMRYGQATHPIERTPYFHRGIDLAASEGTPIVAAADGTVEVATTEYAPAKSAGTVVIVDHGAGLKTLYAHLGPLAVKPGDRVARGQVIARVGVTGLATGPHLHFEVWRSGAHVDPATVVAALAAEDR